MQEPITVRIATLKVVSEPSILVCRGLGSCVGVALYEKGSGIAGMAHILLPSEEFSLKKDMPEKFADKAIEMMVAQMVEMGAIKSRIVAKIAGGAKMFISVAPSADRVHVGERNVHAVKNKLKDLNVPILAEDIGGTRGRTMEFDTKTGRVKIHLADKTVRIL
jgi:chemotaxis protein CheD